MSPSVENGVTQGGDMTTSSLGENQNGVHQGSEVKDNTPAEIENGTHQESTLKDSPPAESHNGIHQEGDTQVTAISESSATATTRNPVICVFCGAWPGNSPSHLAAARELAHAFHKNSVSLVYGGGTIGVMGELARTLVQLSGPSAVHGIIPAALMKYEAKYDSSDGLDASNAIEEKIFGRTTVVQDMHTRKRTFCKLVQEGGPGSGFIALTGGFGTLEELMEVTTWNQLGIHDKGIVVLNVDGYWDGILNWVKGAVKAGFIGEKNADILVEAKDADEAVEALRKYTISSERFKLHWGEE